MAKEITLQMRMGADLKEVGKDGAYGMLAQYAKPELREQECKALERAIVAKHGKTH